MVIFNMYLIIHVCLKWPLHKNCEKYIRTKVLHEMFYVFHICSFFSGMLNIFILIKLQWSFNLSKIPMVAKQISECSRVRLGVSSDICAIHSALYSNRFAFFLFCTIKSWSVYVESVVKLHVHSKSHIMISLFFVNRYFFSNIT